MQRSEVGGNFLPLGNWQSAEVPRDSSVQVVATWRREKRWTSPLLQHLKTLPRRRIPCRSLRDAQRFVTDAYMCCRIYRVSTGPPQRLALSFSGGDGLVRTIQDCCAATDPLNHSAAVSMIKKQGGVFGAVSTSTALITAMERAQEPRAQP